MRRNMFRSPASPMTADGEYIPFGYLVESGPRGRPDRCLYCGCRIEQNPRGVRLACDALRCQRALAAARKRRQRKRAKDRANPMTGYGRYIGGAEPIRGYSAGRQIGNTESPNPVTVRWMSEDELTARRLAPALEARLLRKSVFGD